MTVNDAGGNAAERAAVELRRAHRELEEFTYVASHDLREPLRMINIYTQLLNQRHGHTFDDQGRQFAQRVQDNVARMEQLISDVLEYSRTVHEDRAHFAAPLPLRLPFDRACGLLQEELERTGASLQIADLPVVFGEESELVLVFQNLLSNALKYAHPERAPQIRIWATPLGQFWAIHVSDNGIGFEPEFAERIFGLFKRLHGRDVPGNGLGLAVCRRIIESDGGQIWADPNRKNGATFIFTLKGAQL